MDMFVDYDDPADLLAERILARMKRASIAGKIEDNRQKEILSERIKDCVVVKCRVPKSQVVDLIMRRMGEA